MRASSPRKYNMDNLDADFSWSMTKQDEKSMEGQKKSHRELHVRRVQVSWLRAEL